MGDYGPKRPEREVSDSMKDMLDELWFFEFALEPSTEDRNEYHMSLSVPTGGGVEFKSFGPASMDDVVKTALAYITGLDWWHDVRVTRDGNKWSAVIGEDLQSGACGFDDRPVYAIDKCLDDKIMQEARGG